METDLIVQVAVSLGHVEVRGRAEVWTPEKVNARLDCRVQLSVVDGRGGVAPNWAVFSSTLRRTMWMEPGGWLHRASPPALWRGRG